MFIRVWLYQKLLYIIVVIVVHYSSWFKYRKRIRCWSKSNSTNRICWTIKKLAANGNATDVGNYQSMFVVTITEKIKETRSIFS